VRHILHVLDVQTPRAEVWDALTTRVGLAGWWTRDVRSEEHPAVGDPIAFHFADLFHPVMKVIDKVPDERLAWKGIAKVEPAWLDSTFTFRLEPRGKLTTVTFSQTYAHDITDEEYGRFNYNWGYYLCSLKRLCETGEGHPFEAPKRDG
jgi:uncharacterized protein YndB with AHSA1/START domain